MDAPLVNRVRSMVFSPVYGERYRSLKLASPLRVSEDSIDPLQSSPRPSVSQSDTRSAAPLPVNDGGDHAQNMEHHTNESNMQSADITTSESMQKRVDGAAQRVMVILDASKEIAWSAFEWALEGLGLKPGDVLTLVGVLHQVNTPSTSSFMRIKDGPKLLGHKARADTISMLGWDTKIIEEEVTKRKDDYLWNMAIQHIRKRCEHKQIQFNIVVKAGYPAKLVAVEMAKELRATWIILDRQMKKYKNYFLENTRCGISQVKRNRDVEELRGKLSMSPGLTTSSEITVQSRANLPNEEMTPTSSDEDYLGQDLFSLDITGMNTRKESANSDQASSSSAAVSEVEETVSNPTPEPQSRFFSRSMSRVQSLSALVLSRYFEREPGAKLSKHRSNPEANMANIPTYDSNSTKLKTSADSSKNSLQISRSRSDSNILDVAILAVSHEEQEAVQSMEIKVDAISMARDKYQQNEAQTLFDSNPERKPLHPENESQPKKLLQLFSIGEESMTDSYISLSSEIHKSETKVIVEGTKASSISGKSELSVPIPRQGQEIRSFRSTAPTPSLSSSGEISSNVITEGSFRYPTCSICKYRSPDFGREIRNFSCEDLKLATDNFSAKNFLSEGGFGSVYRGQLKEGQYIAVKQHKHASLQGEKEFRSEVEVLSRAQHRNLVMLLGYCSDNNQRLLVYEYVCNGSLDKHISRSSAKPLEWRYRMKIAKGAARGLRYLHDECRGGCIVHRDMRPSNILVTHDFEPMLGDFGLARSQNNGSDTAYETRIVGTLGYLAPEYAESGKVSTKTDVYSFGVVLLELITGRKALDKTLPAGQQSLIAWARPLLDDRRYHDLIDPRIINANDVHELYCMVRAAALCLRKNPAERPSMNQVVQILEGGLNPIEGPESPAPIPSNKSTQNYNLLETRECLNSGALNQSFHESVSESEGSYGIVKSPRVDKNKHHLCYADMLT